MSAVRRKRRPAGATGLLRFQGAPWSDKAQEKKPSQEAPAAACSCLYGDLSRGPSGLKVEPSCPQFYCGIGAASG